MQLSHLLAESGSPAEKLDAKAEVTVQEASGGGFEIVRSAITLVGTVPGISEETFVRIAREAKEVCPVSKALGAIDVTLEARLA
jgi:osmotically inducible protein OsmC